MNIYFKLRGKTLQIGQEILIKYNGQIIEAKVCPYCFLSTSGIIYYICNSWEFVDDLPEILLDDSPILLRLK